MHPSRLHRRIVHPYYLLAPDYRESSSGIQCVHYLCHALNLEGAEAYVTGCSVTHPRLKTPLLDAATRERHLAEKRRFIAIYPEIVSGNPLGAEVSVRYMLNRQGVLNGNALDAGPDDLYFHHREEFVDPAHPGPLLTVPMVDVGLFSPEPAQPRTRALLYLNRVPRAAVDFSALPPDIEVLSMDAPLPLEALADAFRRARVLYSYESSTTCRLAIMCGCPVVALSAPGYERYAVTEATRRDLGGGFASSDDAQALAAARAETAAAWRLHADGEARFWQQLDGFIDVTQQRAADVPTPAAPLQRWLEARHASPAQRASVQARVQRLGTPQLQLFVLAADAGDVALAATLASLADSPLAMQAHVLAPQPPAAPVAASVHPCADRAEQWARINALAAAHRHDWLMIVQAGERFLDSGLLVLARDLAGATDIRAVCADAIMCGEDGSLSALLRPDFNLDLLLSMPSAMAQHWLFHADAFLQAGGLDPARGEAAELDLLLRLVEHGGIEGLGHVHEPLLAVPPQRIATRQQELDAIAAHLRNRGYDQARIEPGLPGCYRIHYGHQATPGVSIVIPTRNQFGLLSRCVESLLEKTAYKNYEILIVDNASTDADACTWLDGIEAMGNPQLRVLRYPHPFNHSAMNNLAAQHARGEYLLLLNNDTAVLQEDWLDALLNHAQRPEVGVVGARLLRPDGRIQHAGIVLGMSSPTEFPFAGQPLDAPGYMHRLQVDQDYSAVSGACLMIRKSLYDELGGLDEGFEVSGNDVDLCLKVRAAGYLVVWTPHALLMHEGGASLARVDARSIQEKARSAVADQDRLYERWLPMIAHDPAYNRNLTLNGAAFQVQTESQLNWRPLSWRPLPVVLASPADQAGCGHYRIIQPARALEGFGLAETIVSQRYLSPVEMERLAPDTLVLQRQMTEQQIEQQKRVIRFNSCFKVAELDDYLPNVPRKSAHYGTLPKDILKTMRKALTLVDRFIVSTPALAEALDGLHPDIRVVENRLPLPWWGQAKGLRRQGRKPRVGWGGGAGHRGDLEMIADVVAALADEVEWVFFGMCPDGIRPYVHEFHPGVPIEDYPAKLASLNLDLALAPLEDNLFNQCKSNLRLLELGACGFPVVCSDVRPYQCDLPVTRVKPRFRDWVDAIRMHVHDLDAAAKAGDALREAIHRDWMLDQTKAQAWLAQWLPG
ncbi:glycosyltransferase [[Pseudomonas] boreopolis]|uniref:glycosyltransferase n=1 Tax=Xanthomonas boreopolis TaxID=86183 RepID=UPI003D5C8C2D